MEGGDSGSEGRDGGAKQTSFDMRVSEQKCWRPGNQPGGRELTLYNNNTFVAPLFGNCCNKFHTFLVASLLLVAMPFVPSSVLLPSSKARSH